MDSRNAYIYDGSQAPAEQVNLTSGAVSYLSTDAIASVRGVVNGSGALIASASYDPWGNPVTGSNVAGSSPFGFASGYTDPTGLIYLINRYYDPAVGQFISLDPAVDTTGSPYGYASGNPVSVADPTGMWSSACWNAISSCRFIWAAKFTAHKVNQILDSSVHLWRYVKLDFTPLYPIALIVKYFGPGKAWDLKIYLGPSNVGGNYIDHRRAEKNEWPLYARVNRHTQVYFNVWGNVAYGYVGSMAGFPRLVAAGRGLPGWRSC